MLHTLAAIPLVIVGGCVLLSLVITACYAIFFTVLFFFQVIKHSLKK